MTTTTAAAPGDAVRSSRDQIAGVIWFVGLMLAFALVATVAAVAAVADPNLLAFPLAFAPAVIALALAWREGRGAARRLLHQLAVLPADPIWYAVLLLPAAAFIAVDAVAVAFGEPVAGLFDDLFPRILALPLVVLIPAMTEELGWRGFAVPRALEAMSPLRTALALGIPWTLIHIGLFLPGQMNAGAAYWPMATQIMSMSVVLVWVYLGTGRSVLMAALVHALFNGLVPISGGVEPELAWAIRGVVWPGIAIAVVAFGGYRRLERGRSPAPSNESETA
jgi:membrane protease YdiL (CAAX protease family)